MTTPPKTREKWTKATSNSFVREIELHAQIEVLEELSGEGWNSEDTQESIANRLAALRSQLEGKESGE